MPQEIVEQQGPLGKKRYESRWGQNTDTLYVRICDVDERVDCQGRIDHAGLRCH